MDRNIKLLMQLACEAQKSPLAVVHLHIQSTAKAWILHRASLLEPFACFPSEDEQINNKYNQHCVSSRLKGWQAEKICEGGKKKNHENRFPNTRVSYCTPTLWWSWSLWCCRGLYLHKARSKGCKDRDITIWCSNTVYKAGQYKVSEVSSLCLDEKNG